MSRSVLQLHVKVRTVLSSPSLDGFGQVPGSKLIARKKLYAHNPMVIARVRLIKGCDSVSRPRVYSHCMFDE